MSPPLEPPGLRLPDPSRGEPAREARRATGGPFGLDGAEDELLGELFAERAADLGFDGARLYARIRAGRTVAQALDLPDGTTEVLYGRAHGWFNAGRTDRAETLFRALCVLDGRDADHWVGYGVCLRLRDARDEAAVAFATATALRPDWAVPHFHAAGLAIAGGRWLEADDHLTAFAARADAGVPAGMRAEAARLATALRARSIAAEERHRP